jgi:plastocyanin
VTKSHRLVVALALVPALGGWKCIKYDAPAAGADAGVVTGTSHDDAGTPGSGSDSSPVDAGFVPATACMHANTAQIIVQNFEFDIACGCAEASGMHCTVPVGTTVTWLFADSEEHNVTSIAGSFGMSPDELSGQFQYQFTTAGSFGYGCSIHGAAMAGYSIVAQ